MLVMSRKVGDVIRIRDDIVLKVVAVRSDGNRVKIGIEAPQHIRVTLGERYVPGEARREQR